jgi:hypothetical protein
MHFVTDDITNRPQDEKKTILDNLFLFCYIAPTHTRGDGLQPCGSGMWGRA